MAVPPLVTLIGGSGFIGRYAARALVEAGYRVRIASRRVNVAAEAKLAGPPGWVDVVQANIRHGDSLLRACAGAQAVVNLVGILSEQGPQDFETAHTLGPALAAEAAMESGAVRFVQISAIGADPEARAAYARSKGLGEDKVRRVFPEAVFLRPSIVFGPEDQFINRFAKLAASSPFLPAIGGAKTRFQPVYAGDVADAIVCAVKRDSADVAGRVFELGGPRVYTLSEIYDLILEGIGKRRLKLPIPFAAAKPMGLFIGTAWRYVPPLSFGLFGPAPLTGGQVDMLREDNVVGPRARTIQDLGVSDLQSVEVIAPTYLWRFRQYGEFDKESPA